MDDLVNVDRTWAFITGKQNTFLELNNNKSSIFMWFSNFKWFQKGHFIKHKPLISNDYTKYLVKVSTKLLPTIELYSMHDDDDEIPCRLP